MTAFRIAVVAVVALVALTVWSGGAEALAFSRADLNKDGVVELGEATQVFPGLKPVQFRKSDADRDGVVDRGEYPVLDNLYWIMFKER